MFHNTIYINSIVYKIQKLYSYFFKCLKQKLVMIIKDKTFGTVQELESVIF